MKQSGYECVFCTEMEILYLGGVTDSEGEHWGVKF